MKRAFLYGLGSFLIVGIIGGLVAHGAVEIILALVLMPISVVVIRAAGRAPPNKSRAHAIVGWLVGFLVIDVALVAIGGAAWLVS